MFRVFLLIMLITPICLAETVKTPKRFAIYYGYPSLVNGSQGDVDRAVEAFQRYSLVVLGDGVEFADTVAGRTPPGVGAREHALAKEIIKRFKKSRQTRFYGYIAIGNTQRLSLSEIERRVKLWADMGVDGIFLDEAGYDYGVTRERQNSVVAAVHRLNLRVFANAFNPDDLFSSDAVALNPAGGGNPSGLQSLLGARDIYLLESFQVVQGRYEETDLWQTRARKATEYRERFGTRVYAVATSGVSFSPEQFEYAWWGAVLWGLDGFAWGERDYAASSSLPFRRAKASKNLGHRYLQEVVERNGVFTRRTDGGRVYVDTTTRRGGFIAD